MPQVQDTKRCPHCREESVLYLYTRRGEEITVKFWVSPYLPEEKIFYPLEDRKIPKGEIYEYWLRCPSCGEWFIYVVDVPCDVKCHLAEDKLFCVPLDQIREAIIATNFPGVEDREGRITCPECMEVNHVSDPVCRVCGASIQHEERARIEE